MAPPARRTIRSESLLVIALALVTVAVAPVGAAAAAGTTADAKAVGTQAAEAGPASADDLQQPSVSTECRDDGGVIVVENPNDVEIGADAMGDDYYDFADLGPGETHEFTGLDDGSYDVAGSAPDGSFLSWDTVHVDCDDADGSAPTAPDVTTQCVDGEGAVTVENPNDEEITVDVMAANGYYDSRDVEAGGSHQFTGLADADYDVAAATTEGHDDLGTQTVTVDCGNESTE